MAAKVADGKLTFHKGFKKIELGGNEIAWVYLQAEDGSSKMCCGAFPYTIYRVMLLSRSGEKHEFMFEDEKAAKALLAGISALSEEIAVGFTSENKARFGIES